MDASVVQRVRRRGGQWGVRGLRVALARQDEDNDGVVSAQELVAGLAAYGVRPVEIPSGSYAVDAVLESATEPLEAATYRLILRGFEALKAHHEHGLDLGSVCEAVNIDRHPDVERGSLPLREALLAFFSMWGLPGLAFPVNRAMWLQFFADWAGSFDDQRAFRALFCALFDVVEVREARMVEPTAEEARKLFSELDGNRNGALSLAEVDLGCVRLWPHFNHKPAIIRAFKQADRSRNGTLNAAEFRDFLRYLPKYVDILARLRRADASGDGYLNVDEFVASRALFGLEAQSDIKARQTFRQIDSNRGGKITLEELAMFLATQAGDSEMARRTNEFV